MGKTLNTGNLTNAISQDASNNIGIGTAAPTHKLHIVNNTSQSGLFSNTVLSGAVSIANINANALLLDFTPTADIIGFAGYAEIDCRGTNNSTGIGMNGFGSLAYNRATAGTITNFTGFYADCRNLSTGVITNFAANRVITALNASGTVTNFYGYKVDAQTIGSTLCVGYQSAIAAATGRYNLYMDGTAQNYLAGNVGIGNSTPTSKLEVYKSSTSTTIGNDATVSLTNTSATNNNFSSLFFQDANAFPVGQVSVQITDHTNHIADLVFATRNGAAGALYTEKMRIMGNGRVGIGVTAPTAVLHLKAGTATASTAPLKFTSGALNTTAEPGAVEFLTDAYYGTITTGAARRTFAFLESPTFTGTPTLPTGTIAVTQAANTNNTTVATTAYVDANQIFSATLSLTSAQILALNTTPVLIVAAPGAGKYIEVISATSELTFVTAAYATNTSLILINTGATNYQLLNAASLASTVSTTYKFTYPSFVGGASTQIIANTALNVSVLTGNPATGAGTVKIKVLYRIVTI